MAILYSDELERYHQAPFFSKTSCVTLFMVLMTFLLPILLVVRTYNFWVMESYYYEQPAVSHLNELMVVLYTEQATHTFGTTAELNQLVDSHSNKAGMISIQSDDKNYDGRVEQLRVDMSFANIEPSEIKSVLVIQSLSYHIRDTIHAEFKLPLFNIFHTPNGFRKLQVTGRLNLDQKEAYALGALKREIDFERYHLAEDLLTQSFFQIFQDIKAQNTTLSYDISNQFTQAPALSDSSLDSSVSVSLELLVPSQQKIRFKLPILETFKLAWIQYISFFLLAWYVIYYSILGYAFQTNAFESTMKSDLHKISDNPLLNEQRQLAKKIN